MFGLPSHRDNEKAGEKERKNNLRRGRYEGNTTYVLVTDCVTVVFATTLLVLVFVGVGAVTVTRGAFVLPFKTVTGTGVMVEVDVVYAVEVLVSETMF